MAADFFDTQPVFRQWMEIGDRILRKTQGFSPLAVIYDSDRRASDPFDHLEHSHPALFMTQFAAAKMLQASGIRPDFLIGISLGEFIAMSFAGMIPFERALTAIAKQPAIFRKTAPRGTLIAVLASEHIRSESALLESATEIAGVNAETHCVLACPEDQRQSVLAELGRLDLVHQPLPVPYPFHSRWIDPVQEDYLRATAHLSFESPFWPVWSGCLGKPIQAADSGLLWRIVREPMRLGSTIAAIEQAGGTRYIDLSPTSTFSSILRQALQGQPGSIVVPLMSPLGGDLKRLHNLFGNSR